MVTLLLNQNDIPSLTSFDGNIDADKLKPYIFLAQKNDVRKALGVALYNKILADYKSNSLTDVYETIYNDFVVDMLVFFSCSMYMSFGGIKVSNKGNHKPSFSGGVILSDKETARQISKYNQLAQTTVLNFKEFMEEDGTPDVPEFKTETNDPTENKIIPWY